MNVNININDDSGIDYSEMFDIATKSDKAEVLHFGRNRVLKVNSSIGPVVVKCFNKGLKNRLLYSFRQSKACKSYKNATELLARGIQTPMPVGFVEFRSASGLLRGAYYVSGYEVRMTLYEAILKYGRACLAAFAEFVAELHIKGIRHDDLNNSNVRVSVEDERIFSFSLIDLNRMKIYPRGQCVPNDECFKNICRFSSLDDDYIYFVMKYIEHRNMPDKASACALEAKKRHDTIVDAKKWFNKLIKLQYI